MKQLEQWLIKNKIKEVECLIADMTGNPQGKTVSTEKFISGDIRLPESILVQTVTGQYCDEHDDLVCAEDRDIALSADTRSIRIIPWKTVPTAQVIHNCQTTAGETHPLSSRNVLRHVLAQFDELGLKPVIAPEVEFYLLHKDAETKNKLQPANNKSDDIEQISQPRGIDALDEYEAIIGTMKEYCKTQKLDIETLIHESGSAQLELNFHHGDALNLADQVFTFKRTMRQVASKYNVHATFMAKPMNNEPGSSMHIHQSLVDEISGKNVFVDDKGNKSDTFMHYLGGLQKYTPDLLSFYAPNVNSYRRFTKHINAPVNMHWGYDNRTVGLRVPDAIPSATRIENRFSGIDANPYLAIAVSLASGLAGMKNKIQPTQPITSNAYKEEVTIARTLKEGLDNLLNVTEVADILGEDFIKAYRFVKLNEFEEFNQVVTAWEREHLLLNV